MTALTAVIYARVSSAKQAEEELPVASQLEQCRSKAESLDSRVLQVFIDDGISGRSDSRPAFQDAMLFCETEQPDYLITWSSSRFARNRVDAGFYKKRLEEYGVKIVYVSMEVDTSTTGGWLLDGVMEIFDELYSRQVSADTRRSLIKNAREGFWNGGRAPFGFHPVPDAVEPKRKRLVPHEDEAFLVRKIFELKAHENMGARSICRWLNDKNYSNRGKKWTRNTINNLLRNEAVIGRSIFGRMDSARRVRPRDQWIIVESHGGIIPRDLWDLVQRKMDLESHPELSGSARSTHLFTGLLKCGQCGASMQTESAKGRSRRYWYYNCSAAALTKSHKPRRIPSRELDQWLIQVVCDSIFSVDSLREAVRDVAEAMDQWRTDRDGRVIELTRQIESLQARQNNLFDILELHGIDAPNMGDLAQRMKANKEQIGRLQADLQKIEAEKPPELAVSDAEILELADFLKHTLQDADDPHRVRGFLAMYIKQVEILDREVRISYYPEKLMNRGVSTVPSKAVWLPEQALLGTRVIDFLIPGRFLKKTG